MYYNHNIFGLILTKTKMQNMYVLGTSIKDYQREIHFRESRMRFSL